MAAIFRAVLNFPIPQFATVGGALQYGRAVGRSLAQPEMVPWAFVGLVGGGWFIWPAIDEDWKNQFGLGEFPRRRNGDGGGGGTIRQSLLRLILKRNSRLNKLT